MNIGIRLTITGIIAFIFFILPQSASAATLNLSPGSGNIPIGGNFSVQIRLNSGEAVNGVSAFLSYPADKLEVTRVSPGSAFAIEAENSFGGGIIKVSRGSISGVSGNVNVATINFRGKSAGSATVAFIGGSAAPRLSDSSDSLSLGGSRGGTYTVAQATAQPPKSPQPAATGVPEPVVTKLLISDIKTTAISSNSAIVTWKTNAKADSLVEYGLEQGKYFLSSSNGELVTDHKVNLENTFLSAGLSLHFRVKSRDMNGQEAIGDDQALQLLGYQIRIKVTDELGTPQSGVEVLLYSEPRKAITDANGEAIFENVSPGKHLAVVKSAEGDRSADVEVLDSKTATPNVTIKISKQSLLQPTGLQTQFIILGGAGIIVALIILVVIILRKRRRPVAVSPQYTAQSQTQPVSPGQQKPPNGGSG